MDALTLSARNGQVPAHMVGMDLWDASTSVLNLRASLLAYNLAGIEHLSMGIMNRALARRDFGWFKVGAGPRCGSDLNQHVTPGISLAFWCLCGFRGVYLYLPCIFHIH